MTQNNNKPNKIKQSQTKIKQYCTTEHKKFNLGSLAAFKICLALMSLMPLGGLFHACKALYATVFFISLDFVQSKVTCSTLVERICTAELYQK